MAADTAVWKGEEGLGDIKMISFAAGFMSGERGSWGFRTPEGAVETLDAWRGLLESGAKIPNVYAVDVIWPGILAENLVDLKAFVPAQEIASHFPELIANNSISVRFGGNYTVSSASTKSNP